MDRQGDPLVALAAALAAYDEDALAAVANKGLVRRALKDLEKNAPQIAVEGERVRATIEDCTVVLDADPRRCVCTCGAGVCRHVLAAVMYVRRSVNAEAAAPADPIPVEPAKAGGEEILAIADEEIARWAGKPLLAKAAKIAARGAEVEEGPPLIIRLPSRNAECRWIAGRGLEGMLCSCHAPAACEHKIAALLAYRAAKRGAEGLAVADIAAPAESSGAPRTRDEVRASVLGTLHEMVALGLCRLSPAVEQRLKTLAVSAHGVDLPRLERALRSLADEVTLKLRRDAQAQTAAVLGAAARVWALATALRRPTPPLIGEHRTAYEPITGDLRLIGQGARRWRTRSGYAGLTVYFWDEAARSWCSWSESRPISAKDFDPARRYLDEGPWRGCASPREASRSVWRLSNAWRNVNNRLSGRPATRALRVEPAKAGSAPAIDDWLALAPAAERLFAGGLSVHNEHDAIVLLRPAEWGEAEFDPVKQEAIRPVIDRAGRALRLVLRHTPETAEALTRLEKMDPRRVETVLGLLTIREGSLGVEPVTLHGPDLWVNLTLDGLPAAGKPSPSLPPEADDDELEASESDDAGIEPERASPVGRLLASVRTELEDLADAGLHASPRVDRMRSLAQDLRQAGLDACGAAMAKLIDACERSRHSLDGQTHLAADTLLRAAYVAQLAAEQDVVALAVRSVGQEASTRRPAID